MVSGRSMDFLKRSGGRQAALDLEKAVMEEGRDIILHPWMKRKLDVRKPRFDNVNKVWRCKYCNQNRTGTASRLRDHFVKGACNITLLRGIISGDELLRREQGRDAAIAELGGAATGAGGELDLSSSEDETDKEDGVTTGALAKSSTTQAKDDSEFRTLTPMAAGFPHMRCNIMTKHAAQGVKKHSEAVKVSGAVDKRNKVWRCKYCNPNGTGTASRLRDHFLKATGAGGELDLSSSEDEIDKEDGVTTSALAKSSTTQARDDFEFRTLTPMAAGFPHMRCSIMTKHAAQGVKKHFEAVKVSGAVNKGNKVWRCKYCNQNRTGTASRLRDHFLKGACNVTLLRGTISKDELLRREQGRDAAIAKLGGAATGAGGELDLSSSEDEIDKEDGVTTGVEKVQKTSEKLLQLLRLSDEVGPTIRKIYGGMDEALESLRSEECFTKMEREELEEIIMRRWNTMTSLPHCAAMLLDPQFRDSSLEKAPKVMDGFWTWVYSWARPTAYKELDEEVNCWIEGMGKFINERTLAEADNGQLARCWRKWCSELPNLQLYLTLTPQSVRAPIFFC
ncbi:hypothetical protein CBR_g23449 [Chara braunii]|uniref:BED-type domain-containing protein n=1 Tax=Chara braunii TaxID=69332 RepID=A0A388L4J5_CHABU|nr:hypothetical protein CBR_g23449 [Chara braunii]|eukprot:GBG77123.1 hypothetical protein CBR_g23449 [Chara braunii]